MNSQNIPTPNVDVITVNYNGGQLLLDCVTSVLASTQAVRVIVCDNASADESIAQLQQTWPNDDRVKTILNTDNLGFAKAVNQGLRESTADWILLLNPDARIAPDTLSQMQETVAQHPNTGLAGCLVVNEDGSEQRGCRRHEPTPMRSLTTLLGLSRWFGQNVNRLDESLPNEPVTVDAISGSFMFLSRQSLNIIGEMDEGYFLHCEDLDWCRQCRDRGLDVLFIPHLQVTHVKGASSGGRPFFVEWHKHKGMLRYFDKFFSAQSHPLQRALISLSVWGHFALKVPLLWLKQRFAR